jgi:DNA-binding NtrC family response regulator
MDVSILRSPNRRKNTPVATNAKACRKIRVLLVEDEVLIAEWVAESLSEQGFAVQTASNARDALRQLAAAPVDVLFTDINLLGGMDGVALAQQARELLPDLPVIYASARMAILAPGTSVPGSVFLRKPYEPEAAARLIAHAVQTAAAPAFA